MVISVSQILLSVSKGHWQIGELCSRRRERDRECDIKGEREREREHDRGRERE